MASDLALQTGRFAITPAARRPDNVAASELYKSAGFEVEGLRRSHYRRRDGSLKSALLMAQLGTAMSFLLNVGLIFVWATPVVVAIDIWYWMVDFEFGVVNWLLTYLHLGDFNHHDWFANAWTGWGIITLLVVWGAIPFVAITVYAALTQVPKELVEAASIDGAHSWRVFRDVTAPLLKPIFIILTSLSIIWDFQVFNQIWILRDEQPSPEYWSMAVYAYHTSFQTSEYGLGSAIAIVMVAIMLVVSFVYIRQMVKIGEAA